MSEGFPLGSTMGETLFTEPSSLSLTSFPSTDGSLLESFSKFRSARDLLPTDKVAELQLLRECENDPIFIRGLDGLNYDYSLKVDLLCRYGISNRDNIVYLLIHSQMQS